MNIFLVDGISVKLGSKSPFIENWIRFGPLASILDIPASFSFAVRLVTPSLILSLHHLLAPATSKSLASQSNQQLGPQPLEPPLASLSWKPSNRNTLFEISPSWSFSECSAVITWFACKNTARSEHQLCTTTL